uniref:Heme transporter hrg-1 n=1 Tax=Onchocerca volvulus TaxID=6282 RepID=A0A2K6VTN2_ONCVO
MTLTCRMKIRLFCPLIGIISGIMAGLCFAIIYQNWSATTMAFISSVAAANLLFIHRKHIEGTMPLLSEVKITLILAINSILSALCLVGCLACIVLAVILHQNFTHKSLMNENLWITAVWFWMTFKWFMLSAYFFHEYTSQDYDE